MAPCLVHLLALTVWPSCYHSSNCCRQKTVSGVIVVLVGCGGDGVVMVCVFVGGFVDILI